MGRKPKGAGESSKPPDKGNEPEFDREEPNYLKEKIVTTLVTTRIVFLSVKSRVFNLRI